ncbi:cell division protein FtsL [Lentilactobacillus sp. Marseille-Q4993]|uniref:cell division protein FtsL n=1 Tax=Lentilactobacillus sp. Marseille-Q4993 TaxID=3039492 RepID=UPI0024BC63F1|nr:cell division protein FtsL [Lentilactobacillus sp. Marseille-Q4993]
MAQNNLAENMVEEPLRKQSYETTPSYGESTEVETKKWLKCSRFEKLLMGIGGAIAAVMCIFVISSKIALTNSQHQLQQLDNRIVTMHNKNTTLTQQIGELQSSSRLQKIAKNNGMSLNNANIRNVTK